jgi:hypothetical protein
VLLKRILQKIEHNMENLNFSYERVLVMDNIYYSAIGLCAFIDSLAGHSISLRVMTFSALKKKLLASHEGQGRILIITELMSESESLAEGLAFLKFAKDEWPADQYSIIVFTRLRDPVLLAAAVNLQPMGIVHRTEALHALSHLIFSSADSSPGALMSPFITRKVGQVGGVRLPQRELQWFVLQTEKIGLNETAKRMGISYKTAATYRKRVSLRLQLSLREINERVSRL